MGQSKACSARKSRSGNEFEPMTETKLLSTLESLLSKAKKAGAEAADAVVVEGTSLSVAFRLGQPEKVERSEGGDIGLRVFIGKKQAIVSSADRSEAALAELAERAVAMAREVPEDPFTGLADPGPIAKTLPTLNNSDPDEPAATALVDWARRAEDAARAVDGVTNSEGSEAS